jgi:hypothetical protein
MTRKTVLIDQHQVAVRVGQGHAGGACRCFVGVAQDQPVLGGITTDHGNAELLAKKKAVGGWPWLGGGQWLGYSWDDPDIVALADCRYDVGVRVGCAKVSGGITRCDFLAPRVARLPVPGA